MVVDRVRCVSVGADVAGRLEAVGRGQRLATHAPGLGCQVNGWSTHRGPRPCEHVLVSGSGTGVVWALGRDGGCRSGRARVACRRLCYVMC